MPPHAKPAAVTTPPRARSLQQDEQVRLWPLAHGVAYGGDYNPEQWPEHVWREDLELMRQAGVNLVSVGIFSWALLEPEEGRFDFAWLDRLLDLLHNGGVAVDLATPTAAPPAWLLWRYPDSRPVTAEGVRLEGGSRQTYCPSSQAYAEAAARITTELAQRYGRHPALAMWHVHNEYGTPLNACYCDNCAGAFRDWLRARYRDLNGLNHAWGTAFWGQRYGAWEQITPPRASTTVLNPARKLDFMRFCSDALLALFRAERDILRAATPGVAVTTNFMATTCKNIDYWAWAREVDVVANDHYLRAAQDDNHVDLAMAADLTRSLAGGEPWLLMEHSTSAVNWQPRNIAKQPGQMRRNSLAHIARGADGALFFQWRASRSGAEKFHSAMVPHGGTSTRVWREVLDLGADLGRLADLRGSRVVSDIAVVWDWEAYWALELEWRPSVDLRYVDRITSFYHRLWRAHMTVDFVHPEQPLDDYPLVIAPALYLTTAEAGDNMRAYVAGGGTLLVSYFSGVVDRNDSVHPGGAPGPLRDLLGLTVEEFLPLRDDQQVRLDSGDVADVWAEHVVPQGAQVMQRYVDGPAAGGPAITRNSVGQGHSWYVSTRLTGSDLDTVLDLVYRDAGVRPAVTQSMEGGAPEQHVEVVRRAGDGRSFLFVINHGDHPVRVRVRGVDALTGTAHDGHVTVAAGDVAVIREVPDTEGL
jgi:beta-galactosidase